MKTLSKITNRYEHFQEHTGDGDPEDGILAEINIEHWGAVVRRLKPTNSCYEADRRFVGADLTVLSYGESGMLGTYDEIMCHVDLENIDDLIEVLQKTRYAMQKWAIEPEGTSSA